MSGCLFNRCSNMNGRRLEFLRNASGSTCKRARRGSPLGVLLIVSMAMSLTRNSLLSRRVSISIAVVPGEIFAAVAAPTSDQVSNAKNRAKYGIFERILRSGPAYRREGQGAPAQVIVATMQQLSPTQRVRVIGEADGNGGSVSVFYP